jgi:hypothetical protein
LDHLILREITGVSLHKADLITTHTTMNYKLLEFANQRRARVYISGVPPPLEATLQVPLLTLLHQILLQLTLSL